MEKVTRHSADEANILTFGQEIVFPTLWTSASLSAASGGNVNTIWKSPTLSFSSFLPHFRPYHLESSHKQDREVGKKSDPRERKDNGPWGRMLMLQPLVIIQSYKERGLQCVATCAVHTVDRTLLLNGFKQLWLENSTVCLWAWKVCWSHVVEYTVTDTVSCLPTPLLLTLLMSIKKKKSLHSWQPTNRLCL